MLLPIGNIIALPTQIVTVFGRGAIVSLRRRKELTDDVIPAHTPCNPPQNKKHKLGFKVTSTNRLMTGSTLIRGYFELQPNTLLQYIK